MGIILESMLGDDALESFSLVDSKPVSKQPYTINLPFDLPIIHYGSLSHVDDEALWSGIETSTSPARRSCLMARCVSIGSRKFPRDIPVITEELRKFILVKDSQWFTDVIGKVRRQDNIEAFLLRYSSKGSLALYKHRKENTKRQWIAQAAKAFAEAETISHSIPMALWLTTSMLTVSESLIWTRQSLPRRI